MSTEKELRAVAQGLRTVASWLDRNAVAIEAASVYVYVAQPWVCVMPKTLESWRQWAQALPSPTEKHLLGNVAEIVHRLEGGGRIAAELSKGDAGCCVRTAVGTKHHEASDAYDETLYEWKCPDGTFNVHVRNAEDSPPSQSAPDDIPHAPL